MSRRLGSRLPWALFILSIVLALSGTYLQELNQRGDRDYYLLFAFIVFAGFGAFIGSRVPRNPIGWLFMAVTSLVALGFVGGEYAGYALRTNPGSLPAPEWAAWFGEWTWIPAIGLMTTFLFLLFPDGRLPSRRWRPVAWFAGALLGAAFVLGAFTEGRLGGLVENPVGFIPNLGGGPTPAEGPVLLVLFLVAILLSVSSLFFRYRRAPREQRQQLKWFLYAGAFTALSFGLGDFLPNVIGNVTFGLVLLALPAATAVAVLKYRLYDIDVVINKTVIYLVLAAFVTLVYVLVVVAIPVLVFRAESGFNPLPFAAAAIVALAFQPVRRWGSRLANRLVYGKRATPYEVLSEFSQRMGQTYAAEDVLPRMARTLCEGTSAVRTEVWLRVGAELRREAVWPDGASDGARSLTMSGGELPEIPGAARTYPVEHQEELLGALAVSMPRGETFTSASDKLVQDVAAQAGLVLRNVRLIEELRASRQRIVAAQDHERRRLERNIHDGAQQQLVALSVKLRLAETLADRDPARAKELIEEVRGETQEALTDLRDLARGIYPPLLADKGLAAALEAQARKSTVPVEVQPDSVGRYHQETEAAAYFCVLEALQNAAKYADASRVVVRLWVDDGELRFEVEDDGAGFDPERTPRGSGLQNMADRLESLGGRVHVDSEPGGGTTVRGWIPVGGGAALP
jgi:signal transduction histidine kinase